MVSGSLEVYRASYGAKKVVVWLPMVLSADNSTPKLERITNYLFCGALRGIQIFTREVLYFYVLSLALSGSLFLFTVYFLMQLHIRHPRRCIFTLVTFDRHFSAPHIWALRLPG